jgi:TolA-binding protein
MIQHRTSKSLTKKLLLTGASLLFGVITLSTPAQANKQQKGVKAARERAPAAAQQTDPAKMYSLGVFYYNNDDISDKAAEQFRKIKSNHPHSKEAESAQYYLGSYYQRKHYIQQEKWRTVDRKALGMAEKEYFGYIDKFSSNGSAEWLSDSHFNLALIFLQWNKQDWAKDILHRMLRASNKDPKVYVYQVVWSPNPGDVIDNRLDAGELTRYTLTLVNNGQTFEHNVVMLKRWCGSQKSRQMKY